MKNEIYNNPFPETDPDRHQIWEMLVSRDIKAFCEQNWEMVAGDFIEDNFMGIDGRGSQNPDSWKIAFNNLESYKKTWLDQAKHFATVNWAEDCEKSINDATTLRDIEIVENSALVHKKFDGKIQKSDGSFEYMNWQTLYRCRKIDGQWKIAGFTGYLPHPMGQNNAGGTGIRIPQGASQHVTAGPYSPVLEVTPGRLVVISGQAAINKEGTIIGDTIEDQTRFTIENCENQLRNAGCSLNDVFKVNVFLTDLDNWPRFNEVYATYFSEPLPVRTAVQTPLLYTLLVEIEMWAVKK